MAPDSERNNSDNEPPDTTASNDASASTPPSEYHQDIRADADSDAEDNSQCITDWASI